jgi:hypothetical protein
VYGGALQVAGTGSADTVKVNRQGDGTWTAQAGFLDRPGHGNQVSGLSRKIPASTIRFRQKPLTTW